MKIIKVEIHNYRNLDGVTINFAEDCNFVVGENNLGKSNLIFLFNILFKSRSFRYEEFKDSTKPIEINLQLKLADIEIGHFEDLFDTDDYSIINITCKQIDTDDNIEFYHTETNTYIKPSVIRCINYVYYDSLRNPIAEINFDKGKGVGRFLNNIISQYLVDNNVTDKDFFEQTKVDSLIQAINNKISKIKSFKDFDISAMPDDDIESLLSKVVVLKDSKGQNLTKAGYGVQFIILVTLSILEKIQFIKQQRKERGVFEDEKNGTKSISLVLGLDEPEIHLHPYMQRSLIKYLNAVINNQNDDFKQLIKELFDIDRFIGQIIVATHSPSIILDNYKQIVRFYKDGEETKVLSGCQITLDTQLKKHLYLQFPFIKEAFFARCAIFVEGDSEYASFPHFGKTLSIEFDDLGICVIQAHGEAIPQLIQIANKFKIPSVGITDKDNNEPPTLSNHYQTTLRDFELELISLIDSGNQQILKDIATDFDPKGDQQDVKKGSLNKYAFEKYEIVSDEFTSNLKLADISDTDLVKLKSYYSTWFSAKKSFPLGKLIGEKLSVDEIPAIYQTVIKKAQEIAKSD